MKKNIILLSIGVLFASSVTAQVDYSKQKPEKQYIYEGDVTSSTRSNRDTSVGNFKTLSEMNAESNLSARDKSNLKRKALRDKEYEEARRIREAELKQYHFQSNQRPSQQKFAGYNQLITNNDDYKYTKFDSNYFNSSKNPFELQKSSKYRHLFNNAANSHYCWDQAAAYYGLDPWLLFAVAKVESSFNPMAVNRNKDKAQSTDYGLMQINTFWLPHLSAFGIRKEHLMDACTSIFVGAWIMQSNIQRLGYNIDGIGAYNSPNNTSIRRTYGQKVINAYDEVTRDFGYKN